MPVTILPWVVALAQVNGLDLRSDLLVGLDCQVCPLDAARVGLAEQQLVVGLVVWVPG